MLEPDHVGALALTGEIAIRRGKFEDAAEALARLALLETAPAKNRVTAGVAARDLFENKLGSASTARSKSSSRCIARSSRRCPSASAWRAPRRGRARGRKRPLILEELMHERPEAEGRVEAARLAMAIHRDRLTDPHGARRAIVKLLEEAPIDGEAIEMLLAIDAPAAVRDAPLENARKVLVESLQRRRSIFPR